MVERKIIGLVNMQRDTKREPEKNTDLEDIGGEIVLDTGKDDIGRKAQEKKDFMIKHGLVKQPPKPLPMKTIEELDEETFKRREEEKLAKETTQGRYDHDAGLKTVKPNVARVKIGEKTKLSQASERERSKNKKITNVNKIDQPAQGAQGGANIRARAANRPALPKAPPNK